MESTSDQTEALNPHVMSTPDPPPLSYFERSLSRRERKLLRRLWEQHEEGVLWSRLFVRLFPSLAFSVVYVGLVGFLFGWQSPMFMIVVGMFVGILLGNFTYYRVARRNWPMFTTIINWHYVERLRPATWNIDDDAVRHETNVRTLLPRDPVVESVERPNKMIVGEIARQPRTDGTSSPMR